MFTPATLRKTEAIAFGFFILAIALNAFKIHTASTLLVLSFFTLLLVYVLFLFTSLINFKANPLSATYNAIAYLLIVLAINYIQGKVLFFTGTLIKFNSLLTLYFITSLLLLLPIAKGKSNYYQFVKKTRIGFIKLTLLIIASFALQQLSDETRIRLFANNPDKVRDKLIESANDSTHRTP